MIWWLIVHILALLAAARLTRVITTDTITNTLRKRVDRLLTPPPHRYPAHIRANLAVSRGHARRSRRLSLLALVTPPPWRQQLTTAAGAARLGAAALAAIPPGTTRSEPAPIPRWRIYAVELVHCDWCIGFWTSLAAYAATEHYTPTTPLPYWLGVLICALASSYLIGRTAERLDADTPHTHRADQADT